VILIPGSLFTKQLVIIKTNQQRHNRTLFIDKRNRKRNNKSQGTNNVYGRSNKKFSVSIKSRQKSSKGSMPVIKMKAGIDENFYFSNNNQLKVMIAYFLLLTESINLINLLPILIKLWQKEALFCKL
jgi:hypothetical protein